MGVVRSFILIASSPPYLSGVMIIFAVSSNVYSHTYTSRVLFALSLLI